MAEKRSRARTNRHRSKLTPLRAARISAALEKLTGWIDNISRASIDDGGMFGIALRAATVKNWEFAVFVHGDPPPAGTFFLTATLRGICEDLISLSFLSGLPDSERNTAVGLLLKRGALEGMRDQAAFFTAERSWQPVLRSSITDADAHALDNELRGLSEKLGWTGRQPWPTVWYMAKATGLTPIYNYLYSATSRWVHFSPNLLARMGWATAGSGPNDNTTWRFTTMNFSAYYLSFNKIYSVYLLIHLLRGPAARLSTQHSTAVVRDLEGDLSEIVRWPEIITYEEMNLKGPDELTRLLLWAGTEVTSGHV